MEEQAVGCRDYGRMVGVLLCVWIYNKDLTITRATHSFTLYYGQ